MKSIHEKEFLTWAAARGIDTYRPNDVPSGLIFKHGDEDSRFWDLPPARRLPHFFWHALTGLPAWSELFLWPRHGHWPGSYPEAFWHQRVQFLMLRGAGVSEGAAGALVATPHEMPAILTTAFTSAVFGGHTGDDVYLIPDNGRAILWVDHHDVLHVSFHDRADVQPFVEHMAAAEYLLPGELPDETFRKPEWMEDDGSEDE